MMEEIVIRRGTVWHPIWAVLQAFPLAFFTTALVTDIAYVNTFQMQWANFSVWLIFGGLFMGGIAILAAVIAAAGRWRSVIWRRAFFFAAGCVLAWLTGFVNFFVHSRDAWTSVMPMGLALSIATTVIILVTSWIGYADIANRVVTR